MNESKTKADINCTDELPTITQFFTVIPSPEFYGLIVCSVVVFATFVLFFEEMYQLYGALDQTINQTTGGLVKRSKITFLLFLYPMTSFTSLLAVCIPRSIFLNSIVASMYLSLCIYKFVDLMISYMGGPEGCVQMLSQDKLSMSTPPCCCCCICLPLVKLTRQNLKRIVYVVGQLIIVRPILTYIHSLIVAETRAVGDTYTAISVLTALSTVTAMWGLAMIYRTTRPYLKSRGIAGKFICMQLLIVFSNLQGSVILKTIQRFGGIPCQTGLLATQSRAANIHNIMLIAETFLLAILARRAYFIPVTSTDDEQDAVDLGSSDYKPFDESNTQSQISLHEISPGATEEKGAENLPQNGTVGTSEKSVNGEYDLKNHYV
ncbi:organic solute transporter subunit alpha-like [Tubulanus polymorphus]|uniref:organic solute transporter subunit alpha-like n=1 Tax=Tubulanus polymorphus TaxID=672921 RepID=UPI003DA4B856